MPQPPDNAELEPVPTIPIGLDTRFTPRVLTSGNLSPQHYAMLERLVRGYWHNLEAASENLVDERSGVAVNEVLTVTLRDSTSDEIIG